MIKLSDDISLKEFFQNHKQMSEDEVREFAENCALRFEQMGCCPYLNQGTRCGKLEKYCRFHKEGRKSESRKSNSKSGGAD